MANNNDRDPPISINEALIVRHFARDATTRETIQDPVLTDLHEGMKYHRLTAEKMFRVTNAILKNELQTVPARHKQARTENWKLVEPVLRSHDVVRAKALAEKNQLEARTKAPPAPRDGPSAMLASEVRARLAGMSPGARKVAMHSAIAEQDDAVAGAILNGPAMLSGLSAEEHEMYRHRWRQQRHGADLDRIERLTKAVADFDQAGTLLLNYTSRLSNADIVEKAEASERAVSDALKS